MLVLQVEQIAMMRPKAQSAQHDDGLLEYLEDIIGSNRHVPAITQAAEEVGRSHTHPTTDRQREPRPLPGTMAHSFMANAACCYIW